MEKISFEISDYISKSLKNHFTVSQDPSFDGFKVIVGGRDELQINPNAFTRGDLNQFSNQLGQRENVLKATLDNIKQYRLLAVDNNTIPDEILQRDLNLEEIETNLFKVVKFASYVAIGRSELAVIKSRIESLRFVKSQFANTEEYRAFVNETNDIDKRRFVYPPHSHNIMTDDEGIRAEVLASLSFDERQKYLEAKQMKAICLQLGERYSNMSNVAIAGNVGDRATVDKTYRTGLSNDAKKDTLAIAEVVIAKTELIKRSANAYSIASSYDGIENMVDERVSEIKKDRENALLDSQKKYDDAFRAAEQAFTTQKRNDKLAVEEKITAAKNVFEIADNQKQIDFEKGVAELKKQNAALKFIVPVAKFTEVVNSLLV